MAIDYKKEWEKLMKEHGDRTLSVAGVCVSLRAVMQNQKLNTISKREKLMKHYLISGMETDITGASQYCHSVNVGFHKNIYGNVSISKADFDAWCKKKGGKG